MVVQCPKCQEAVTFDARQLEDGNDIKCESCQSVLKMQIIPELVAIDENAMTYGNAEDLVDAQSEAPPVDDSSNDVFELNDNDPSGNDDPILPSPENPLSLEASKDPIMETMEMAHENVENTSLSSVEATDDHEKILLCIDGEATREAVGDLLKDTHYRLINIPSEMDALMSAEIDAPKLALIDADLLSDEDANLCAELKKHPSLKDTIFILVGSMFDKNTKYRTEPPPMKGADDYIERYYLQNDLLEKIRTNIEQKEGVLNEETDFFSADPIESEEIVSNGSTSIEDAHSDSLDTASDTKALEEAQQLARIIVSDICIYNEKKVEEGIRTDTFYDQLEEEIEEGRLLFESRVSEDLRMTSNIYEKALEDAIDQRKGTLVQDNPSTEALVADHPPEDLSLDFGDVDMMESDDEAKVYATPPVTDQAVEEAQEEDSEEVKSAKRLARIIVSDIVIYNEKKVEEGLQKNTFYELLEDEIGEGRQLYASRVDKRFLDETDYLQQAFDDFINKKKESVTTK